MNRPKNPLNSDDERKKVQSMDIDSFTVFLFRWLKDNLNTDRINYRDYYPIENLGGDLFPGGPRDPISEQDRFKLSEAIVNLERKRLVVRVFDRMGRKPVICLSTIGVKSDVDDYVLLLVDKAEDIVTALEEKIGRLDNVVRQYYLESLRAYQEELYISSVICLGAASERAIHWLANAIEANYPSYRKRIQTKRNNNIRELTKYLSDNVIPNVSSYDKTFAQTLVERLDGLAKVYRENRNEAGHPKTVEQSWLNEDQGYLLLCFRRYIATISEAVTKSATPTTV